MNLLELFIKLSKELKLPIRPKDNSRAFNIMDPKTPFPDGELLQGNVFQIDYDDALGYSDRITAIDIFEPASEGSVGYSETPGRLFYICKNRLFLAGQIAFLRGTQTRIGDELAKLFEAPEEYDEKTTPSVGRRVALATIREAAYCIRHERAWIAYDPNELYTFIRKHIEKPQKLEIPEDKSWNIYF